MTSISAWPVGSLREMHLLWSLANTLLDGLIIIYTIVVSLQTVAAGFHVGFVEVLMVNLFAVYGVTLSVGATATALIRISSFWIPIFIGFVYLQQIGMRGLTGEPKKSVEKS